MRPIGLGQRDFAALCQTTQLIHLSARESGERRDMTERHHHQVSAVIGIQIKEHVAGVPGEYQQ
jgi:hypothetical protein